MRHTISAMRDLALVPSLLTMSVGGLSLVGRKFLVTVTVMTAVLTASLSSAVAEGDDPLFRKVVLFENEAVQVLDLRYEPGSVTPLHTHEFPNRVLYIEAGGILEILPGVKSEDGTLSLVADAEARRVNLTAGQTLWLPAATHMLRNVGETFVRVIEIEIK